MKLDKQMFRRELKFAIVGTGYAGRSKTMLSYQNNEVIALHSITEKIEHLQNC